MESSRLKTPSFWTATLASVFSIVGGALAAIASFLFLITVIHDIDAILFVSLCALFVGGAVGLFIRRALINRISLRTLVFIVTPACASVAFFVSPTTDNVNVDAYELLIPNHFSLGRHVNIYSGDGELLAFKCRIVAKNIDRNAQTIIPIENTNRMSPDLDEHADQSYLTIRVNWLEKFRINTEEQIFVVGMQPIGDTGG